MNTVTLAATIAVATTTVLSSSAGAAVHRPAEAAPGIADAAVVLDWNAELLKIVRTPGAQPATVHPTRSFALLHAAIYDAVASVSGDRIYRVEVPVQPGTRPDAAAATAAHDTLAALYPSAVPELDALLGTELRAMPDGQGKQYGADLGRAVAAKEVGLRSADGSATAASTPAAGSTAGAYRPAPPKFAAPVFGSWGQVKPFVLDNGAQFRPAPPPALDSADYARALNEVRQDGQDTSTARTAYQTDTATFWSAPIWNYWNEIAQREVTRHGIGLLTTAQLFAELNLTIADDVIAFYEAKYHYAVWRPVTAIREAAGDGNPDTTADPTWMPLSATPPDPSYPGAHSAVSSAAADVLAHFFGVGNGVVVTSEAMPGVTRTFDSYHDVATEAGLSRIYAGVHTRSDARAGEVLGARVADYVRTHWSQPYR
jgi:membrane-associated phospholipid phosphatase